MPTASWIARVSGFLKTGEWLERETLSGRVKTRGKPDAPATKAVLRSLTTAQTNIAFVALLATRKATAMDDNAPPVCRVSW